MARTPRLVAGLGRNLLWHWADKQPFLLAVKVGFPKGSQCLQVAHN